jgi:hypothetical protein
LIIRIGGIRECRNGAHREEQGFVQTIEQATKDISKGVHKAACFLGFNLDRGLSAPWPTGAYSQRQCAGRPGLFQRA